MELRTSDLNDDQVSLFRNKKLGFIFQFSNLLSDLTVLGKHQTSRQIGGNAKNAESDSIELLKIVGLEDHMHKRSNKISGGQAQRAAIARGLINNPSVVLADEPTGNLDSITADTVVTLMKSMAKKFTRLSLLSHMIDISLVMWIE